MSQIPSALLITLFIGKFADQKRAQQKGGDVYGW